MAKTGMIRYAVLTQCTTACDRQTDQQHFRNITPRLQIASHSNRWTIALTPPHRYGN